MKTILVLLLSVVLFTSCSENYGHAERTGTITKFGRSGLIFDSWEGELHVTQTGMNSTMNDFEFSIDNNVESQRQNVINTLDSAAKLAWKVRLMYHEVKMKNITSSRGDTNFFVDSVQVVDRNMSSLFNNGTQDTTLPRRGHIIDTIYVIIDKSK